MANLGGRDLVTYPATDSYEVINLFNKHGNRFLLKIPDHVSPVDREEIVINAKSYGIKIQDESVPSYPAEHTYESHGYVARPGPFLTSLEQGKSMIGRVVAEIPSSISIGYSISHLLPAAHYVQLVNKIILKNVLKGRADYIVNMRSAPEVPTFSASESQKLLEHRYDHGSTEFVLRIPDHLSPIEKEELIMHAKILGIEFFP